MLPFISKKTTPKQTTFSIENPPKEGFFKLQIYARKKPTKKGRLKIPLVANFLVAFRHSQVAINQPVGVRKSFTAAAISEVATRSAFQRISSNQTVKEDNQSQKTETNSNFKNNSNLNLKQENQISNSDQKQEINSNSKTENDSNEQNSNLNGNDIENKS